MPRILIGGVIVVGLAMIAAGVIRSSGGGSVATEPVPEATETPTNVAPAVTEQAAPSETDRPAAAKPKQPRPVRPLADAHQRDFDGFAVAVPSHWAQVDDLDAIHLRAPGGDAEIRFFYGPPGMTLSGLESGSIGLLNQDHPDGKLTDAVNAKFKGFDAVKVQTTYGDGTEQALAFATPRFSYVILTRLNNGVRAAGEQAAGILASFRPA